MSQALGDLRRIRTVVSELHLRGSDVPVMLFYNLLSILFEFLTLGMLFPLFVLAQHQGDIAETQKSQFVGELAELIEGLGFEFSTPVLLVSVFVVTAARKLVDYKKNVFMKEVELHNRSELQKRSFARVMQADIALFHHYPRGQLFSAIRAQSNRAAGIAPRLVTMAVAATTLLLYVAVLFFVQHIIALLTVALVVPLFFIFIGMTQRIRALGKRATELIDDLTTDIYGFIDTALLVKLKNQGDAAIGRVQTNTDELRDVNLNSDRIRIAVDSILRQVIIIAVLVAIYLSFNVFDLVLAKMGLLFLIIMRSIPLVTSINNNRYQILMSVNAVERMSVILSHAVPEKTGESTVEFSGLREAIRVENVTFRYRDLESGELLGGGVKAISATIERGQQIGLVGRSGAGKSTLVHLLAGLYAPDEGQILLDGKPLSSLDIATYRRRISFVMQSPVLLRGTIRKNLEFGLSTPLTEQEIQDVLQRTHCQDFVEALPKGYDTDIKEAGIRLSGGERQRLSIAAALASKPDILILDEPTSALDSEAEEAIQRVLSEIRGDITVILIAHRLSTIKAADSLLVLEDGEVTATGRHIDLMETSDRYRRLFDAQMRL